MRASDIIAAGIDMVRRAPGRSLMSSLGICLSVAAVLATIGIAASSRADVLAVLDQYGTGVLIAKPGEATLGGEATLPTWGPAATLRLDGVYNAGPLTDLDATIQRNHSTDQRNALHAYATNHNWFQTINAHLDTGRLFTDNTDLRQTVVGANAATTLGINATNITTGLEIRIGDHDFHIVGILKPLPLHPDLDRGVYITTNAATPLGYKTTPTAIYIDTNPDHIDDTRQTIARTLNPTRPNEITMSRPSDTLTARTQIDTTLTAIGITLAATMLLTGIANITNTANLMLHQRRKEIGLRRALGATRIHIAAQFIAESAITTAIGALAGTAIGILATLATATHQHWPPPLPLNLTTLPLATAPTAGPLAAIPTATKAAKLDPTTALTNP